MAMRIAHMLVYFTDEGFGLTTHNTHMDRDAIYEEARKMWYEDNALAIFAGRLPLERLDILVPLRCSDQQVLDGIDKAIKREALESQLLDVVLAMLMASR